PPAPPSPSGHRPLRRLKLMVRVPAPGPTEVPLGRLPRSPQGPLRFPRFPICWPHPISGPLGHTLFPFAYPLLQPPFRPSLVPRSPHVLPSLLKDLPRSNPGPNLFHLILNKLPHGRV